MVMRTFGCHSCKDFAMHPTVSAGNSTGSTRPRKEKRLSYVFNYADNSKHCAGINCLALLKPTSETQDYVYTGSRDGTLKRWVLEESVASCCATFESHVDWVNDAVIVGDNTLISGSSDTTLKVWNCLSDGTCTATLRKHYDHVTCLATVEKNSNIVASGALGGEVLMWDLEAALAHASKPSDTMEEHCSNGISGGGNSLPITGLHSVSSSNSICTDPSQTPRYSPLAAKGHKESVYALAMNESGTHLVSGGTEKVVRVWDPRSGSKTMKLKGHTDNIRALLLDSSGRFCLSGSSDSMIRLWDLGQQRCIHSYAVHTDSVWALASPSTFSHVYSGGRDMSLYLTDLATRESLLLCTEEQPVVHLALHDDSIWVATPNSSVNCWPAEGRHPQKAFERGGSFFAGNLSFSRARVSLEGSSPIPVYKEPKLAIPGNPWIMQHEVLNNRRHVLTKDSVGSVKLWEITRGVVVEDYGKVSFEEKKEELFEMVSIPAWFTVDTRFGCLSIHLDTPQCFSAEMYSVDLNITGNLEDDKVNLGRETLKGLLAYWLNMRRQRMTSQGSANGVSLPGNQVTVRSLNHSRIDSDGNADNGSLVYPPFEFSSHVPPSIITEGSHGGLWRRRITDFDGSEDEKDLPWWCLDCVLNNRLPPTENTDFYLHPSEGSTVQILTQGKLSGPRILRIHKVVNYVLQNMVLEKPLDVANTDGLFAPDGDGPFRSGSKSWQKLRPSIDILCNNQVLSPEMSLATVRAYIWKKAKGLGP